MNELLGWYGYDKQAAVHLQREARRNAMEASTCSRDDVSRREESGDATRRDDARSGNEEQEKGE